MAKWIIRIYSHKTRLVLHVLDNFSNHTLEKEIGLPKPVIVLNKFKSPKQIQNKMQTAFANQLSLHSTDAVNITHN